MDKDEITTPPKTYTATIQKDCISYNITLSAQDVMEAIHVICKTERINQQSIIKIKEI